MTGKLCRHVMGLVPVLAVCASASRAAEGPDRRAQEAAALLERLPVERWSAPEDCKRLCRLWGLADRPVHEQLGRQALRSASGRFVLIADVGIYDGPGLVSTPASNLWLVSDRGQVLWRKALTTVGVPRVADTGTVALCVPEQYLRRFRIVLLGRAGRPLCTLADSPLVGWHGFSSDGARYYFARRPWPFDRDMPDLSCVDLAGNVLWRRAIQNLPGNAYAVIRPTPAGPRLVRLHHAHVFPMVKGLVVTDDGGRLALLGATGPRLRLSVEGGRLRVRDRRGSVAFALPAGAAAGQPPEGANVSPWRGPARGLRSRLVIERPRYKQGEAIWARVELSNAGDEPAPCLLEPLSRDYWSGTTRYVVFGPDGVPARALGRRLRVARREGRWSPVELPPGHTVVLVPDRLDLRFYMRPPGAYHVHWPATWDGAQAAPPATATATVTVTPAPGGGPDGDLVGRLLRTVPAGWSVKALRLLADDIQPMGWLPGRGSVVSVWHFRNPGCSGPETGATVWVLPNAARPKAKAEPDGEPLLGRALDADYLGESPIGHVYLGLWKGCGGRWRHAAHDIGVALDVANPPPRRAGPDWGRMLCRVLDAARARADEIPACRAFWEHASFNPWKENELAAIRYWANLMRAGDDGPTVPRNPLRPSYRVELSVREAGGKPFSPAHTVLRGHEADLVGRALKRLRLEVHYLVETRDERFREALLGIIRRELRKAAAKP